MTCPQDNLLLRLISGELSPPEERELRAHLDACAACQSAWAELRKTWETLGAWKVPVGEVDLASAVFAAVDSDASDTLPAVRTIVRWPMALRAAASIGVAAGLGIAAGYLIPLDVDQSQQISEGTAEADDVLESLGLFQLAADSATGLSSGFDTEEPSSGEEASS